MSFDDEFVKELAERIAERLSSTNGNAADGFLDVDGAAAFLACPASRHRMAAHASGEITE